MQSATVTGAEYRKNRDGTVDKLLLQVEISDPEDVQTAEMVGQSGIDINPFIGSKVFVSKVGDAWKIATASGDDIVPDVLAGEIEIYSNNGTDKLVRAKCKADSHFAIANSVESVEILFDDLIEAIKNIVTIGSPSVHTLNGDSKTALETIKTRFLTLFGSIS